MSESVLEVRDLVVEYSVRRPWPAWHQQTVRPVNRVDLTLAPGEILGLVGESGCGKSTLARAMAGLRTAASGSVKVAGVEASQVRGEAARRRRRQVQLVFQDPVDSLNPRLSVEKNLQEAVRSADNFDAEQRSQKVDHLLQEVGLALALRTRFPHELSGGQRQRIALARALAVDPLVLVADELTSALDVSVQARILNVLRRVQTARAMAIVLISHDLVMVNKVCQRVCVMYHGRIVEEYPLPTPIGPRHPYSRALISAVPSSGQETGSEPVPVPSGEPISLLEPPPGCPYASRCQHREDACLAAVPPLIKAGNGQYVRCPVVLRQSS